MFKFAKVSPEATDNPSLLFNRIFSFYRTSAITDWIEFTFKAITVLSQHIKLREQWFTSPYKIAILINETT